MLILDPSFMMMAPFHAFVVAEDQAMRISSVIGSTPMLPFKDSR